MGGGDVVGEVEDVGTPERVCGVEAVEGAGDAGDKEEGVCGEEGEDLVEDYSTMMLGGWNKVGAGVVVVATENAASVKMQKLEGEDSGGDSRSSGRPESEALSVLYWTPVLSIVCG